LVELLIALSISAALLTATAVAVDASFRSYAVNQEQASLTQRARLAMYRILTSIRTTDLHQPKTTALATTFSKGTIVTDTGIAMFTDDGVELDYVYDDTNKQLLLIQGGTSHVMLHGVDAFQVKLEPMRSADSIKTGQMTYDRLMRATVLLTVRTNDQTSQASETTGLQTVTLSGSVMPRRNVW
jgi:Tfp pilus assembly protein PilW